jgi:membrane-bound metal-dependent hydrolase YbcI (DUF457 family)
MGVGHLAVGLMLKRAEPRVNLGLLFFATLLPDFLLGVFYWLGLEQASVPGHYEDAHSVVFSFPYSHGLLASLLWSVLVFLLARYLWQKGDGTKIGIILGLAVFSHFILDFIVHVPDLPVLGRDSYKLGLGLWDQMTIALTLEMLLVVAGLIFYLNRAVGKGPGGRFGIAILMVVFSVLTVVGMRSSVPPNLTVLAVSWLVTPLVLSGIAFLLDRSR